MKNYPTFINESIIDSKQKELSPEIFETEPHTEEPRLREYVKDFLVNHLIKNLASKVKIIDYVMLGSTLTHRYTTSSDIDINVLIEATDSELEEYRKSLKDFNGTNIPGTKHPVNFFLINNIKTYNHNNNTTDAIFDISENKFIRIADESRPFDVGKYMDAYRSKVEKIKKLKDDLEEDLVDYDELKNLTIGDRKSIQKEIQKVISEIDEDAEELVDMYDNIKDERRVAFSGPLTAKEIRLYGSKNRLPENVVYKLLEKHYWLEFLHKIEKAIGEDKKVQPNEIEDLKKAVEEK